SRPRGGARDHRRDPRRGRRGGEPGGSLHPHHGRRRGPGLVKGPSALGFIALRTLRNMVLRQLRRALEPRYLVATLFGLFYIATVFLRPGAHIARGAASAHVRDRPVLFAVLTAAGLVSVLFGWLFGGDEGGLAFSEAEIQFLFPAPLSRRQLIHYKLVRTVLVGLVSAAILTIALGRTLAHGSALFILGAWIGMVT